MSDVAIDEPYVTYREFQEATDDPCLDVSSGACTAPPDTVGFIISARITAEGMASHRTIPVAGRILEWFSGNPPPPEITWTLFDASSRRRVKYASFRQRQAFSSAIPEVPEDRMRHPFFVPCLNRPPRELPKAFLRVEVFQSGVRLDFADGTPFAPTCPAEE